MGKLKGVYARPDVMTEWGGVGAGGTERQSSSDERQVVAPRVTPPWPPSSVATLAFLLSLKLKRSARES